MTTEDKVTFAVEMISKILKVLENQKYTEMIWIAKEYSVENLKQDLQQILDKSYEH